MFAATFLHTASNAPLHGDDPAAGAWDQDYAWVASEMLEIMTYEPASLV